MNQETPVRRKKVLFVITKATWGGAQRYLFDLAKSLPQNEFTPALAYGVDGRLSELFRQDAIRVRQIPALARNIAIVNDVRSFFQILRTVQSARPDVLHLNSSKAAAFGALAGRIAGVPRIVFTVHGWPFKEDRGPLARGLIYLISWLTALLSHAVITVSHTDERLGMRMWGLKKKLFYIPLGTEPLAFRPPQEAFRAMFGTHESAPLAPKTLRLVSIAELTKNKGLTYAIEAVALLRERGIDAVYVIAGTGEEMKKLEKKISERGLREHVFLVGFIESAALNLSGFDVFLLPSIKEGMPYVFMEAAGAGLPIVATDAIDEELAEEVENVRIVPSQNALAIADAVEDLSKRSRTSVARNLFPVTEMVQQTLALYRA